MSAPSQQPGSNFPTGGPLDYHERDKRAAYSVEETARFLGIGRTSCYRACARNEIPTIRIGARILVPRAALERLLAQ